MVDALYARFEPTPRYWRKPKLIAWIFEDVYTNNHKKLLHTEKEGSDRKVSRLKWPDQTGFTADFYRVDCGAL